MASLHNTWGFQSIKHGNRIGTGNYISPRQLINDKCTTNEGWYLPSHFSTRPQGWPHVVCSPTFLGPGCHLFPSQVPKALKLHSPRAPGALSAQAMKFFVLLGLLFLKLWCHAAMLFLWPPLHCCQSRLLSSSQPFTEAPQDSVLDFLSFSIFMNKCMNFKGPPRYKPLPSLWI